MATATMSRRVSRVRRAELTAVAHHRVRHGQQVIVADPKMRGYLPVASPDLVVETHLPSEVMLRFSTATSAKPEVFLHALGATATFGRDFGVADQGANGFALGTGPTRAVLPPMQHRQGCHPLPHPGFDGEFIYLLDRGGCVFLDKLTHATAANASGVILFDQLDPTADQAVFADGHLVRPSADGVAQDLLDAVARSGLVFTAKMVGDVVKRTIEVEERSVVVEILPADGPMQDSVHGHGQGRRGGEEGARGREGRLALGQWEIWNLKIVEAF